MRKVRLWPRIAKIAAALTVVLFSIYFITGKHNETKNTSKQENASLVDVEPGKNTAKLTLDNGKTIQLSDQKNGIKIGSSIIYDDNTTVFTNDDVQLTNTMLTATTPRGGTYQFILPDGTKVWLNADSKISFPFRFTNTTREISLQGEAYFEVAKDKTKPFIVNTAEQEIVVYGTHFNVKSYADEPEVKTTLLEGSVKVTPNGQVGKMLIPGQQAVLTKKGFNVINADVNLTVAWKNGDFSFSGQDIQEAMRTIARWYNVEVEYKVIPTTIGLEGEVSRSKKLSTILKVLESTGDSRFSIVNKTVVVTK